MADTQKLEPDTPLKRVVLGNGIELDTLDIGPRDAPTLIFLHGFPENGRTWRHQIAHFSDRYRCIVPDQRGYRGSSKPQDVESYTTDKLIGDVFLLADALGVDRFTIVGHDWGGAIAWGVAIMGQGTGIADGRVTRCIIANAPHPALFGALLFTNRHQRESSQYMRGFRDVANDALVREQGLGGLLAQEINWDAPDKMEPVERAKLVKSWEDRDAAFAMLNWYRASIVDVPPMDVPFELPQDWEAPALPNMTQPTLVIWGMDDTALPPENLEGLNDVVDDLRIVELTDHGHFTPWEAAEKVNQTMDAFLVECD